MDVPLHLRLAYAHRFSDPYGDPRRTFAGADLRGENAAAPHQGDSWFSTLVRHLERNGEEAAVVTFTDDKAESPAAYPAPHQPERDERPASPLEATASMSVPPLTSPALPPYFAAEEETRPTSALVAAQAAAPQPREEKRQEVQPTYSATVGEKSNATIQADVGADTAASEHRRLEQEKRAGVHEELLSDLTTALERRLQQCVLKTLALDDANQQLICSFQLPPSVSSSAGAPPVVAPQRSGGPTAAQQTPFGDPERTTTSSGIGFSLPVSAAVPDVFLVANHSGDSLPEDAKKELAMHLYALRRQVVGMRQQLDAHEETHARQVNAFRASAREAAAAAAADRPPVRVEVVKAYAEEPVPYRKGPYRPANFAAAKTQEEEAYSSDAFTSDTDAAAGTSPLSSSSSAISSDLDGDDTARGVGKQVLGRSGGGAQFVGSSSSSSSSSSTVSSTEELFRQRQAAALRARAQRTVSAGANHSALKPAQTAAPPGRHSSNLSSSTLTSSHSSYSSLTDTTTTTS